MFSTKAIAMQSTRQDFEQKTMFFLKVNFLLTNFTLKICFLPSHKWNLYQRHFCWGHIQWDFGWTKEKIDSVTDHLLFKFSSIQIWRIPLVPWSPIANPKMKSRNRPSFQKTISKKKHFCCKFFDFTNGQFQKKSSINNATSLSCIKGTFSDWRFRTTECILVFAELFFAEQNEVNQGKTLSSWNSKLWHFCEIDFFFFEISRNTWISYPEYLYTKYLNTRNT